MFKVGSCIRMQVYIMKFALFMRKGLTMYAKICLLFFELSKLQLFYQVHLSTFTKRCSDIKSTQTTVIDTKSRLVSKMCI